MSTSIQAVQFTGDFDAVERFVGGDAEFRSGRLVVATPQGALWASRGEWIVKDPDGTFWTCAPADYAALVAASKDDPDG